MKIFAMISTRSSERYTPYAIDTFFSSTKLATGDRFILIDNDASFMVGNDLAHYPIEVVKNSSPLGFAANMNGILSQAVSNRADVVLLNNDVIFTPDWYSHASGDERTIVSPLSSREVRYSLGSFEATNPMELSQYLGNEHNLRTIAQRHSTLQSGRMGVLVVPFFASRIPLRIIESVGLLDEKFGRGGGEDYDYCLRAILNGFAVEFELSSYVLHFGGKSSWSGAETTEARGDREKIFLSYFQEKWGEQLFRVIMKEEISIIENNPELSEFIQKGDFASVVQRLR